MPFKDKEKAKEYLKEYRLKNKESIQKYREENKEYIQKYQQENKEKISEKGKKYYEKIKEKRKEFFQTEKGIKIRRITSWKHYGVVSDDFDVLYDKYINTTNCEECNIELTVDRYNTKTTRCLDHDHTTGLFRNVLCQRCNVIRG